MSDLETAARQIKRWKDDPAFFVHDQFHVEPDLWQLKALREFPSQDPAKLRISLQSCAGPGKSALLAWCGWNFLACYGDTGRHPKGAAVSITADNLKDNLWPEFKKWQDRSPFLSQAFTWTKHRIFARHHPETWFISARSWSKTANADEQGRTLSGLHSEYVLVLIDESGNIPTAILKAAEQALSNCKWGKIMQAGNPTSRDGILYAAATTLRHLWFIIRVTGDPDDPARSKRISIERAREQIATFGRDNAWVMAYILGEFPPTSINHLLGPDDIQKAMQRHLTEDKYSFSQRRLGVDVARFGDDRTVIFPRQGLASFRPVEMRNARSHDIAARVAMAMDKWPGEAIFLDVTGGWGAGVEDALLQGGRPVFPVEFAGKALDSRYYNKRTEIWFQMADWIKRGAALPYIEQLSRELSTPMYWFDRGKFRLEEKDQIKSRLGFSPDYADGLACTFALPDMPTEIGLPAAMRGYEKMKSDYDPLDDD